MKSTVEDLTAKEVELLALWYGTDTFKAFKRLCQLEIDALGKDALSSMSHEHTRYLSGQASMAANLPKLIRGLSLEKEKNKQLKQQQG